MEMFLRNIWAHYLLGERVVKQVYKRVWIGLFKLIPCVIGLILLMWAINAYGGTAIAKEWNLVFFFLSGPAIPFFLLVPRTSAIAMVAGMFAGGLKDEDLSQSAMAGLTSFYYAVRATVLWFWVLSGLLATWSFAPAPGAFFVFAAMGAFLGLLFWHYEMNSGIVAKLLVAYAICVMLAATWKTVPEDWKPDFKTKSPAASASRVAAAPGWVGVEHKLRLNMDKVSETVRITGDRCIRWWGESLDRSTFQAELRGINDYTWYTWDEFKKLKAAGKVTYAAGWVRFKALEPGAIVFYEFRYPGQCT